MWNHRDEGDVQKTSLQKSFDYEVMLRNLESEIDQEDLDSETDPEMSQGDSVEEASDGAPDENVEDLGLLVVGGANDDLSVLAAVSLITESGVCSHHALPDLPEGRRGGVAGLVGGGLTVVVCGGFSDSLQVSGDCWQLSRSVPQWLTAPPLPRPTAFAAQVTESRSQVNSILSSGFSAWQVLRHWGNRTESRGTKSSPNI